MRNFLYTYRKEILLGVLFFLACSISFALGYLTHEEFQNVPIVIEKAK